MDLMKDMYADVVKVNGNPIKASTGCICPITKKGKDKISLPQSIYKNQKRRNGFYVASCTVQPDGIPSPPVGKDVIDTTLTNVPVAATPSPQPVRQFSAEMSVASIVMWLSKKHPLNIYQ